MIERHAARAAQPSLDIAYPNVEVLPQPGLGDRALGDGEKIVRPNVEVLVLAGDLIRQWHLAVEHFLGDRDQSRMRYPGTVMPVANLALLVGAVRSR